MNNLKYCFFILLVSIVGVVAAQGNDGKNQINQVKRNHQNYFYGDQYATSEEEAIKLAMAELEEKLNAYAEDTTHGQMEVVVGLVKEVATITIERGDKYRAFVYVQRPDVKGKNDFAENPNTSGDKNGEKTSQNQSPAQEPDSNQTPVSTSAVAFVTEQANAVDFIQNIDVITISDILKDIMTLNSIRDLGNYLPAKHKSGSILHYEDYNKLKQPESYFLVVCDRQTGKIVAVLSPGRGSRTNLKTRQVDKVENYQNCKIIGFRLAK